MEQLTQVSLRLWEATMKVEGKLDLILRGMTWLKEKKQQEVRFGSKNSPHRDLKFPPRE